MDTKRTFSLARRIKDKIGQSVCVEQSVWVQDDGRKRSYYKLIWFVNPVDCEIKQFNTYNELAQWAEEKFHV
jgi:hypothetical protein